MPKKVLNILDCAYRATIEEQDDTVVWLTHALNGAGTHVDVLLAGNAVNYAVRSQDASGLAIGGCAQTQPPRLAEDISKLVEKGCRVSLVQEDALNRGLEPGALISGLTSVSRSELPRLFSGYDLVWKW